MRRGAVVDADVVDVVAGDFGAVADDDDDGCDDDVDDDGSWRKRGWRCEMKRVLETRYLKKKV